MSVKLDSPLSVIPYHTHDGAILDAEIYYCNGSIPSDLGFKHGSIRNAFCVVRDWYCDSASLFRRLNDELEWGEGYSRHAGKSTKFSRLIAFMGDLPGDKPRYHTYSGQSYLIKPWDSDCESIRDSINSELEIRYDSSLLNLYSSGNDKIGWHGDKDDRTPIESVATVSLGGTRRFYLRNNGTGETIKTELHCGDLVIMTGNLQSTHQHSIPVQKGADPRISITYRKLIK